MRDKRTPKDVCGEAIQKLDAIHAEPSFLLLTQKLFSRDSLVPWPVRAIRVTRGGLEPSAIANFPNKLDR